MKKQTQTLHIVMNLIHNGLMIKYPPFDALVAFEAAARHGSMTLAADELGVTQSAVSHRVRRLEAFMKVPLLVRRNAGLKLSPAGEIVFKSLKDVFERLLDMQACCSSLQSEQLRIGVGAALADNWLVRRLPEFAAINPDVPIELITVENEAPERLGDLDLRILWLPLSDAKSNSTQQQLFQEYVFPVCHPSLLSERFVPGCGEEILKLPLLYKGKAGYNAGEEWSWSSWFKRLGLSEEPEIAFRFASIGPAIAAALQGTGVVLARSMLVYDALADGRLVRVVSPDYDLLSGKVHVVRWPARLSNDSRVKCFVSWLGEKVEEVRISSY